MALDNYPSPAQDADVGIKISKPNFDAARTRPENLLFSSSWPSLPIAYEITIPDMTKLLTYPTAPSGEYKVPHGLKYPPLTFYWAVSDVSGKDGIPTPVFERKVANVDSQYVYIEPLNGIEDLISLVPPVNIKCFALDLRQDVDYPSYAGDTFALPYDADYGIKVSKENKDASSTDLRDFILHSRAQSPLIQAVKTDKTTNAANPTTVQYTSTLPYPVWVYGFVRGFNGIGLPYGNTDFFFYAPYAGMGFPQTSTDGVVSLIAFGTGALGATLVVLRDPMFAATQETVQY